MKISKLNSRFKNFFTLFELTGKKIKIYTGQTRNMFLNAICVNKQFKFKEKF